MKTKRLTKDGQEDHRGRKPKHTKEEVWSRLFNSKGPLTHAELAGILEVCKETAKRYVKQVREDHPVLPTSDGAYAPKGDREKDAPYLADTMLWMSKMITGLQVIAAISTDLLTLPNMRAAMKQLENVNWKAYSKMGALIKGVADLEMITGDDEAAVM